MALTLKGLVKGLTLEGFFKLTEKDDNPEFLVTVKKRHDRGVHFAIELKVSEDEVLSKEFMVSDNILTDLSK